ncbi:MAG: T9SS type A sorting domain-containing protein [Chitinivibrionales bacterium]|nr:T9SS type A sorting domain-containing protein [Chitinivibrionales bacterium]
MKAAILVLAILFFLEGVLFAQNDQHLSLGTPASIVEDVIKENIRASSEYHFIDSDGALIRVFVRDFYLEGGILSMSGGQDGSEGPLFILKGDTQSLYGWVLLRERNCAYEYTTDASGRVVVEKVSVSKVFCVDDFKQPDTYQNTAATLPEFVYANKRTPPAPHIGKYPGTNLNKLQSFPAAKKVIFLDISRMMSGENPKSQSKDDVWWTWQCVAGGYSMYQVNVTTDKAVYDAAGTSNGCILRFLDTEGRSSSPVSIFGTTQYATVYRLRGEGHPPGGYSTGRTALHESGHIMGVYDYGGQPGGTYFEGFPQFKWVPIMGNFWFADPWKDDALQQWSKGEYNTATTKADVLAVANRYFPYRQDDIPATTPLKFTAGSTISAQNNTGQICPTGDSDGFTFDITEIEGHVELKIDRIEYLGGSMLDVDASLVDASGKVVVHHNAPVARYAQITADVPTGTYTLLVKGGVEGTPQVGFSNYSSLGYYAIEGTITGGGSTAISKSARLNQAIRIYPLPGDNARFKIDVPPSSTIEKIALYSLKGALLSTVSNSNEVLELAHVSTGIYSVHISVDGARIIKKIVKM